ncbi:aldolase superfamily protein [Striga asiatica]|uniref:Aldolase superfamily protein n=1 Tax=Striga asiatica TaxID=4170 RepID=A0A5A7QNQ4_STRAF|nr:aldolase superfamily protein [Striga asiatica]
MIYRIPFSRKVLCCCSVDSSYRKGRWRLKARGGQNRSCSGQMELAGSCCDGGSWSATSRAGGMYWDGNLITALFSEEDAGKIMQINSLNPRAEDKKQCDLVDKGKFSVKKAYSTMLLLGGLVLSRRSLEVESSRRLERVPLGANGARWKLLRWWFVVCDVRSRAFTEENGGAGSCSGLRWLVDPLLFAAEEVGHGAEEALAAA